MDIENINKQIQTEKDSYNRDKNRLKQELSKLKDRHLRRLSDLQQQKEQAINQYELSENIFKSINCSLSKLIQLPWYITSKI